MSTSFTFTWPSGPKEVIVTGTFDSWGKSLPLVKQTDGSFELTVPFAKDTDVLYKYVVDGEWLTNPAQAVGKDSNGIENNVLTSAQLTTASAKAIIPEAGGLAAIIPGSVNTTVMPKSEGKQTTLGEPGIFVPQDKENLEAFKTFENTDRDLNAKVEAPVAELSAEEKKKQKKKLKRTRHKLNKKLKSQGEEGGVPATSSSTESTPAPEEDVSKKAVPATAAAIPVGSNDKKEAEKTVESKSAPVNPVVVKETTVQDASEDIEPTVTPASIASKTAEKKEVIPEKKEVIPEKKEVIPEKKEVIPEKKEVIPEKKEVIPEKKEVIPEKKEVIQEKKEVIPEKKEVAAVVAEGSKDDKVAPVEATTTEAEKKGTLDPTVVGVIGAAAGAGALAGTAETSKEKSADAVAAEILKEKVAEPSIKPAIAEPIEAPKEPETEKKFAVPSVVPETKSTKPTTAVADEPAVPVEPLVAEPVHAEAEKPVATTKTAPEFPAQLTPSSKIEDVPVVPVAQQAKEVTALPVNGEKVQSEEEIIIAQGGHDTKEIEEQIVAAEKGPVSVEELQPTVSEAKRLAEEAHIPLDEIQVAPVVSAPKNTATANGKTESSKTASSKTSKADGKEKKKRGFFSKLKKIFK